MYYEVAEGMVPAVQGMARTHEGVLKVALWTKAAGLVIVGCNRACNSVGECHLHTVEVVGSNPIAPIGQGCSSKLQPFLFALKWNVGMEGRKGNGFHSKAFG